MANIALNKLLFYGVSIPINLFFLSQGPKELLKRCKGANNAIAEDQQ